MVSVYSRYDHLRRAILARRVRVLGLTETTDDPRFATPEAREANRREVITIFDEAFARITYPDWERAVHEHGLIATRVNELTDLATDEQILANEYIQPG